ncbi:MAG: ImmA/IrrE family metallo-endopeptidase [Streptosporangiaceae bacterium]|nr:ImmA/IrrE family metallo-endopeptidase [Streptosporangiaceae bacterium]
METALGARIRAYREQAGVQSRELAARLEIDPSAMSNIERGRRSVKTDELVKIAEALGVSPLALLDEESLPARMPLAARRDGESSTIKGAAYARLLALSEIHAVVSDAGYALAPKLDLAPEPESGYWKTVAENLARRAAEYLAVECDGTRRFAKLVEAIEDKLQVDVLVEKFEDDPLSGAAISDKDFPLIFVNSQHRTPRSLFTLAHELGHLLLRHDHDSSITVDGSLAGNSEAERQANAFAAAFLMPEAKIDQYIRNYSLGPESLARMLYDFGVSFESLVFRLHNLRKIDSTGRDRLQEIGWQGLLSVIEGSDLRDHLGPEKSARLISRQGERPDFRPPIWLASRCFAAYRKGVISVRPLAGLFNVDPEIFLDRIQELDEKSAETIEGVAESPRDEQLSDDELFAGSPVV